ncbi:ANTAR domain-containing protein [Amycolatopsis sp. NBC_01488]|uniref:ANTAR domain-containing protein n=1 Tax=Amycolatopsis sp. NBC_01488 TaxID=2903563 RepID=UPI002E2B8019|nr:ANTAR domain-containing protein [Amycolatopsis sp. NBC_01488]
MDGQPRERLWRAIAAAAEVPGRRDSWAQTVCLACVDTLEQVDAAILALRGRARAEEVLGASDQWAAKLAELQYTVGEGPGVEAFGSGSPVLVSDLSVEQVRWPGFADAALAVGAAAVFAFPLRFGAIRFGTLELVRRRPGGLPSAERRDAALAADLATAALLRHTREAERAGHDFAPRPVASFQDVNVATGMLAAQLQVTLDDAFARLRAHAFGRDRSVLDVARDILERRISLDELAE